MKLNKFLAIGAAILALAACKKDKGAVTITLDPNGGTWADKTTAVKTFTGTPGDPFNKPANPTKADARFTGWEGADEGELPGTFPANDATYKAKWGEPLPTVTLSISNFAENETSGFVTATITATISKAADATVGFAISDEVENPQKRKFGANVIQFFDEEPMSTASISFEATDGAQDLTKTVDVIIFGNAEGNGLADVEDGEYQVVITATCDNATLNKSTLTVDYTKASLFTLSNQKAFATDEESQMVMASFDVTIAAKPAAGEDITFTATWAASGADKKEFQDGDLVFSDGGEPASGKSIAVYFTSGDESLTQTIYLVVMGENLEAGDYQVTVNTSAVDKDSKPVFTGKPLTFNYTATATTGGGSGESGSGEGGNSGENGGSTESGDGEGSTDNGGSTL